MKYMNSVSIITLLLVTLSTQLFADDVVTVKTIGLELARDLASESVTACRKMGYQVSAVVVDRNGNLRAALHDNNAVHVIQFGPDITTILTECT